ncbi:hypothetical protein [Escherichia coli]|uniref:hypothetical protein n=1 Tax=Escherichia coli TaxID=562 RepID=UPI0038B2B185
MLMDNEKIKSETEFNALCLMIGKDLERIATYIDEYDFTPRILNKNTTAGKRESLIHERDNLLNLVTIVSNAGKITAPKIDI